MGPIACTVLDPESPWQKSPKTTSMPRARAICDPQRRRHKKHVTEHGVHLCTKFDAPPSQHATCRCQESGHFIVFPMEVQGAGTFRHVARKQGFSWGNGASHRVHEMVPIRLGWFQRFLILSFLFKKLLSFSAGPIISQWEDPKHGCTLSHVTGAYDIF